ncbi:MAG TPA: rhomboid family intramembrane serine protease [Rhizobiales bacterium]|nr:rhomboid family intramembrane serine protease [Hyphomicrobiales bacterium]
MFNVPQIVVVLIASFIVVHLLRQWVSSATDEWIVLRFAFSAGRYITLFGGQGEFFPGGTGAAVWSFFSHMFLHGSWEHLLINSFWMLAFGSVVARRFGGVRFLLFSLIAAACGALANLIVYWGEYNLMIGASGAIAGQMAAAVRLMYSAPGGLSGLQTTDFSNVRVLNLAQLLQVRGAVLFLVIWVVLNLVFGISGFGTGGGIARIAWEAHLGGFAGGLLLFGLFDPRNP